MRSFVQTSILLLVAIFLGFSSATENGAIGHIKARNGHQAAAAQNANLIAEMEKLKAALSSAKKNVKTQMVTVTQAKVQTQLATQTQLLTETISGQVVTAVQTFTRFQNVTVTQNQLQVSTATATATMMMPTTIIQTVQGSAIATTIIETVQGSTLMIATTVTAAAPSVAAPSTFVTSVLSGTPSNSNAGAAAAAVATGLESVLNLGSLAVATIRP